MPLMVQSQFLEAIRMKLKNVEDIYPLSPLQQGLLFHSQCAPNSGMYCEQLMSRINGPLDVAAFKRAWDAVVQRHSILRTCFVWESLDQPLQVVRRNVELPWREEDWRMLPPPQQQAKLQDLQKAMQTQGFDFSHAPLMAFVLLRLEDESFQFLWSNHHILLDRWSRNVIIEEVFSFYEAFRQGKTLGLPPVPGYREYIDWLLRQDKNKLEEFWQERLKEFTEPSRLQIDLDLSGSEPGKEEFEQAEFHLSLEETSRLQRISRENHITVNIVALGAWAMMLSHYTGKPGVAFGTTVSGRSAPIKGIERLPGLFINTLLVRVSIPREGTFLSYIEELQKEQVQLREYDYTSLANLQTWSGIPSGTALFESLFVFQSDPRDVSAEQVFNGIIRLSDVHDFSRNQYPLVLHVVPGERLFFRFTYDRNRFSQATIERLKHHLHELLKIGGVNPNLPVSMFPGVAAADRDLLLGSMCGGTAEYKNDKCLHELFEEQVELRADAIAVECEEEYLSYGELNQRANQAARHLRSLGAGPESRLGICMDRNVEAIIALLAVLKVGAAYVPLDPGYPGERLAFVVKDAGINILLGARELKEKLPDSKITIIQLTEDWPQIECQSVENLGAPVCAESLVYILYTSGSTGRPKGVMVTHGNVVRLFDSTRENYQFTPFDRWSVFHSFAFDFSVWELWGALTQGATAVIVPAEVRHSPAGFYSLVRDTRITVLNQTPSFFQYFLQEDHLQRQSLAVRYVIFGGEALPADPVSQWFYSHGDEQQLINMYGITETTVHVTFHRLNSTKVPSKGGCSIGRPLSDLKIFVTDDAMELLPIGVPGEMLVGGAGLARGYLNQPGLTAERFVPDPFGHNPGNRLYRAGDAGWFRADGTLEYLGRIDQQVKIRGHRIELGEIEAVVREHPEIRHALVLVETALNGDKHLVLYVVMREESLLKKHDLLMYAREKLPAYMVPSAIHVINALPLTANGKLDRNRLMQLSELLPESSSVTENPRNDIEEKLVAIWSKALNVQKVGIFTSFFELGGHSLLAMQLVSHINKTFGVTIPIRKLLDNPTIAEIATTIVQVQVEELEDPAMEALLASIEASEEGRVTSQPPTLLP